MKRSTRRIGGFGVFLFSAGPLSQVAFSGPVPLSAGPTTVSYQTTTGPVSFSEPRDFNGQIPGTPLPGAPNISTFSDLNGFGRRPASTVGAEESFIAHAFFKLGGNRGGDFFPNLVSGGSVSISVSNIQFDRPVEVDETTAMFHTLFDQSQIMSLSEPYERLNNHYTIVDEASFRDRQLFPTTVFTSNPSNTVFGDPSLSFLVTHNAPDNINVQLTFPYELIRSIEEVGLNNPDPAALPAPQGFLEPFHFHLEYVVVPEPAALLLLLPGVLLIALRRLGQ